MPVSWTQTHGRSVASSWAVLTILFVAGCGKEEGPTLSDANQLFLKAQESLEAGDQDQALEHLNASLAAEPNLWAYRERAKLFAEKGEDKAALADCEAALKLVPDDVDIPWIKAELAKPVDQRFQGRFKTPPSTNR
jgi:tetratricopeptide (TPR) repeat protein